jgi:hypothetical protein
MQGSIRLDVILFFVTESLSTFWITAGREATIWDDALGLQHLDAMLSYLEFV